jgi:hypothetical protein
MGIMLQTARTAANKPAVTLNHRWQVLPRHVEKALRPLVIPA